MTTPRRLRPRHILPSAGAVWLVDGGRPAAAVVRGDDVRLVTWDGERFEPMADGAGGLVVASETSVTWLAADGSRAVAAGPSDLLLSAADAEHAWYVDDSTFVIPDPRTHGTDEPAPSPPGRIVRVARDGTRVDLATTRPVRRIRIADEQVVVTFALPPVVHPEDHDGFSYEYPRAELRITMARLLAGDLDGDLTPPARGDDDNHFGGDRVRWSWLERDITIVLRRGIRVGGLVWWAGADLDGSRIDRHVLVHGYDPRTGRVVVALDAGAGLVVAGAAVEDELWLAVSRQRFQRIANFRGVEVVAISRDGSVRTIYEPDSIDISATDPLLDARPSDARIAEAIKKITDQFELAETYWHDGDGNTHPLADGMSDVAVTVDGDWPHTCVAVALRHPSRPGVLLRRTFGVFDERGRPISRWNADIGLMEDLDTGYLPPADEAVGGVLEI